MVNVVTLAKMISLKTGIVSSFQHLQMIVDVGDVHRTELLGCNDQES